MPPTTLIQRAPIESVCNTQSCLEASKLVLSYVNFTVDPCSDFYQYTCGSWLQSPPIVEKYNEGQIYTLYHHVQSEGVNTIIGLLEGTYDDIGQRLKTDADGFHLEDQAEADRANFQFLKDYYNVCMNTDLSSQLGPTPVFADVAFIQNELFPIGSTTVPYNLANTLAFFIRRGVASSLVNVELGIYEHDHAHRAAYFGGPNIGIVSTDNLDHLAGIVWTVLGEPLTDNSNAAFIHQESQKAGFILWTAEKARTATQSYIELSRQIAVAAEQHPNDRGYIFLSLNDLNTVNPLIDWSSLLNNLSGTQYSQPHTPISAYIEFFERLQVVLSPVTIQAMQDFLIVDFALNQNAYFQQTSVSLHSPQRWTRRAPNPTITDRSEICASDISTSFPDALGRYYTLVTFGASKEVQRLEGFVKQMQVSWLNHIPGTPWLDQATAVQAYEKINLLEAKVGFKTADPDWREPNSIRAYYDGFKVDNRGYYYAKAVANIWNNDKKWKALPLPRPVIEWGATGHPNEANAYYNRLTNQIEIGVGIAQLPFYDSTFPEYLNYGGLGATIGHELVHALDSNGRLHNATGYEVNWWSNDSLAKFEHEAQCFINEYAKYEITNNQGTKDPVDAQSTLGENIADTGGLSIAFNAYQEMVSAGRSGQPEALLPGPEFSHLTPEQLFFISYGISFCTVSPPQPPGYYKGKDHTNAYLRTNIPLQNLQQFSATFDCPVGSPMNPHKTDEERCKIW